MQNILIIGSNGQLGSEISDAIVKFPDLAGFFYDLPQIDITDASSVASKIKEHAIDLIINCAAYTAVDQAEADIDAAYSVNRDGPAVLGRLCKQNDLKLIHISTDYVFSGSARVPYRETDATDPIGIYGKSKLAGEQVIRKISPSHLIIRTAWLYSTRGNNFVKTMLRLGLENDTIRVVSDQMGSPTYARDLAWVILTIINKDVAKIKDQTYHFTNEGVCSWYDFARAIMVIKNLQCQVQPIATKDYPTLAARPQYSVLNSAKIKADWGLAIPYWRDSLTECLAKL
ncbi:MAG: dTDP-4-dehydrorhamnose reductase [Candidatus Marinimicrobia bacterium]|nr:dTDP-4-dehydrorhamnose reductase [Candidatus Neomarinimicrobiota bacterium]